MGHATIHTSLPPNPGAASHGPCCCGVVRGMAIPPYLLQKSLGRGGEEGTEVVRVEAVRVIIR